MHVDGTEKNHFLISLSGLQVSTQLFVDWMLAVKSGISSQNLNQFGLLQHFSPQRTEPEVTHLSTTGQITSKVNVNIRYGVNEIHLAYSTTITEKITKADPFLEDLTESSFAQALLINMGKESLVASTGSERF
jgi:hypothetical protein